MSSYPPSFYPPVLTLFRSYYASRRKYLKVYRDLCAHYGYKTRVIGGWRFFEYENDLITWRYQR